MPYGGYGYTPYFFDWTMLLLIPAIILSLYAQTKVNGTFSKFSQISNRRGYTGEQIARQLLLESGITDVSVEKVRGHLTDHYDPSKKVLRLSDDVYGSNSISAISVAAHETGHAIQHNKGYAPLAFRSAIFPIVNIGSKLAMPLIFLGLLFSFSGTGIILKIGIIMFSLVVLFQIITLPVEFNASSRAIKMLGNYNYLSDDEIGPAKKVLSAAALTYVAAAASALAQLLRLLIIFNRRND